jgi:SAM-dependent methyltransferase
MMHLLDWYRTNYKVWKAFKRFPLQTQQLHFWPSETYLKYPPDTTFDGLKVLNFGCGRTTYKAPNVVNLDVHPDQGVDVVCTSNALPFENDTFDLIIANHVLEHVPDWFESFKEMARVVKPGGKIEVWIPPVSSDSSFTYRDHINRIGIFSFAGTRSFGRSGHNLSSVVEFQTLGDVTRLELETKFRRPSIKWWLMLAWPSLLTFFADHLRNTVSEEGFIFRKV